MFSSSKFQSGIKNPTPLKQLLTLDLSDFNKLNCLKSDKSFGKLKIGRNTFIQKPPFPQR